MRDSTYFWQFQIPPSAVRSYHPLGPAKGVEKQPDGLCLKTETATVEVTVLAPDLFRVGMFEAGRPLEYASPAIAKTAWDPVQTEVRENTREIRISTTQATTVVHLDPLRIRFEDASGRRFAEDDQELGMGFFSFPRELGIVDPLGPPVRLHKRHSPTARYFGCGERTGGLDRTHTHPVFWNVDPPGALTPALNNLYTSLPLLLTLDSGQAWGLFFDNPCRIEFDLALEDPEWIWFGAEGGNLIYYLFAGPTPRSILDRYTALTGRTPLPPLWALGYHQSRWGYRTAEDAWEIAQEFRKRDIPCDALYLDIDYMDGFRVFTWDRDRFPHPKALIDELAIQGFHVVTIVDAGVKVDEDYEVYTSGRDGDFYCKTFRGGEYHNVVWPGVCAYPDFSNSAARAWWGDQHGMLTDQGVAGIWCDMNEPTGFMTTPTTLPLDAVQRDDKEPRLHAQVHNFYGSQMAQATREGLERLRENDRPFVISRAGYAGLQRHALHWTGDNSSWWEHLWMSLPQIQNLGLSGLAWVGADVGGFMGDATGELLTRWTEAAIFYPFCRNHSARNSRAQEPWAFGPVYETILRRLLKLRQRLVPCLYTVFEECHRTGAPVLRPLLFEYPEDQTTLSADDEFLLGDALLVAPITRPGIEHRHVYLPSGRWSHFWTGQAFAGPAHLLAHAPLGQPAIYVRANTPVPLWPEMNYVDEHLPDPLTILLFPARGQGEGWLYEDAGEGYEYRQGVFARTLISCRATRQRLEVVIGARTGSFVPQRTRVRLEFRGLFESPEQVSVDGTLSDEWQWTGGTLVVTVPATAEAVRVEVRGRNIVAS